MNVTVKRLQISNIIMLYSQETNVPHLSALTWRCSSSAAGKQTHRTVYTAGDDAPSPETHPVPASSAASKPMRIAVNRHRSDSGSTADASERSRHLDRPASSGGQTHAHAVLYAMEDARIVLIWWVNVRVRLIQIFLTGSQAPTHHHKGTEQLNGAVW